MYARGMSQRDIAATIEDMYGFQLSHEQISNITDCVMEEVDHWRTSWCYRCLGKQLSTRGTALSLW